MKVALIGATGYVGSRIREEALSRGHSVTAIARNVDTLQPQSGLRPVVLDLADCNALAELLTKHDAAIVAVKYHAVDPRTIIAAARQSGVTRVLAIGGAGSLQAASGTDVVDTPDFPEHLKTEARAARDFLQMLREEPSLDWTYLSPSALLKPGTRTGGYRIGGDQLLVDGQGVSSISLEDLAKAIVDELEQPKHLRQRFTIGY